MTKRQVVIDALEFRRPAYVPWAWGASQTCGERLKQHLGVDNLSPFIESHFLGLNSDVGRFEKLDDIHYRDVYGVVWDRSVDRDIGTPVEWPIHSPADLDKHAWPDPTDESWYADVPGLIASNPGLFNWYAMGFSLYERAWTMRGMAELLTDMIDRPEFVGEFMDRIVELNLVEIRKALSLGADSIYFGDDYGMQTGLIMGIKYWRHFIKPRLASMFEPVRQAGKYVFLHSCGRVQELFDDLVEIGLNMFNPFQPEVMDVFAIKKRYHGRLAFHGGMSIQKVLPFGTADEVRRAAQALIDAGRDGGYVFSPSHTVPPDVPPENLVAMMEVLRAQPGYPVS